MAKEGYNLLDLNKRLKPYQAIVKYIKGDYKFITKKSNHRIPLDKRNPGMISEGSLYNISKILAKESGEDEKDINVELRGEESKESKLESFAKLANAALAIFSLALIIMISARAKLLTGFAVSNISDTSSNVGIIICVVCIVGLAYWRFKGK